MQVRPREGAYLGGMLLLGIVAAIGFVAVTRSSPGATALASPTPTMSADPERTPRPRPSPRPTPRAAAPSATASPSPSPSPSPGVTPSPTPFPAWFEFPSDLDPEDGDLDGLGFADEERLGTSPYDPDSDYGGELDGAEVAAGRNPLDEADDVPPETCIPPDAKRWDGSAPDETPPAAPELEALIPPVIGNEVVQVASMRGLPRVYGFFNFFWDSLLVCAGGQPDDLSHAIGVRGELPGLAILAIHVDGTDPATLGADLSSLIAGQDRSLRVTQDLDGRRVTLILSLDADGLTFAFYAHDDVLFLVTGMGVTDSGLWPGGVLDGELLREAVGLLPR